MNNPIALPWTQANSTRPIYDCHGKVVSFTERAPQILAAMNLVWEMGAWDGDGDDCTVVSLAWKWVRSARDIVGRP